jgi:hypothetical protein
VSRWWNTSWGPLPPAKTSSHEWEASCWWVWMCLITDLNGNSFMSCLVLALCSRYRHSLQRNAGPLL